MNTIVTRRPSAIAVALYELLNPIPYGFFVAALVFDIIYIYSTNVMWEKSASWLITLGLFFAIIPRLINLAQIWIGASWPQLSAVKLHFWLNAIAIIAAIINAFVHSRDAYAVAPENVTLSVITVGSIAIASLILSYGKKHSGGEYHE